MPHAYLSNTITKLSLHYALGRHDMWHLKLACGAACRLFELEPSQIGPPLILSHPPPLVTRSTEQPAVQPVLNCHRPPSHRFRFDLIFETSSEVLPNLPRLKLQDINKRYTRRLLVLCLVLTQFTANYLELLRKMHETQLMNSQKSVCRKDPKRFQTAHLMFSGSQSNKKK